LELRKIGPNIYHFIFPNQYELTSTFMRLQEFYESPLKEVRGKFFTHEEYMDIYAKEHGSFSYLTDWNGMNVPGNIAAKWYRKFAYGGTYFFKKERRLIDLLIDAIYGFEDDGTKFYVIGTHELKGEDYIDHELCHAIYYLNPKFKKEMLKLVKNFERVDELKNSLTNLGYCEKVLDDEVQAYMATSKCHYMRYQILFNAKKAEMEDFRKVFKQFKKGVKNE